MLSAHMDHIGFIVVAVEKEGFLRVMPVGGVGLAVSRTRHVSFQNGVQGVIVQEPVREGETPAMKHMFIDIGAADETEALSMVTPTTASGWVSIAWPRPPWTTASPAPCW